MPTPRLLDQARERMRVKHYSLRTEESYLHWIRRFVLHHGKRHPRDMAAAEVEAFLSHLATEGRVSASTQNQALAALLFLYREVLGVELPWMEGIVRAKRPARLPVVLTEAEVRALLAQLDGTRWIAVSLLYSSGMRLLEGLRLRVKDVDFERREIIVRRGKGQKDRHTVLPGKLVDPLRDHLELVRARHRADVEEGRGFVELPDALRRKYPSAPKEWPWQRYSPRLEPTPTRALARPAVTTFTRRSFKKRFAGPPSPPEFPSTSRPTPSATPSRLTSWNPATTSARSKSSSVTRPPVPTSRETVPSGNVSADGRRMDPRPCPRHPQSQFVKSYPKPSDASRRSAPVALR
jgi:integron integrase